MKKLILVLALIFMIATPVLAVDGTYTTNGYFYMPPLGGYGADEFAEYNAYMQTADDQIEANKTNSFSTINTEAKLEAAISNMANIIQETEIDTFSELQALVADKTITKGEDWDTHAELAAILNIGIIDDYLLEVDGLSNANEYARFTANGLVGRTEAEFKGDFNLEIDTDIQQDITNYVLCSNYANPDDAITAIDTANKTLLVTEAETCDTNFTVPANVTVRFERGGKWTINGTGGGYITTDVFTGTGLDDLFTNDTFTGGASTDYKVEIDGVGTPNTFKWSDDGGATWDATLVQITGAAQTLNNGVEITFGATTGHTATDYWTFTGETGVKVTFDGQIDAGLWQIFAYTGTGTITGCQNIERVYPQWFGAKGDGTTDDVIPIQQALESGCKVIFLSEGIYVISISIEMKTDTSLIGEGKSVSILKARANKSNNAPGLIIFTTGADNNRIQSITVDGDKANHPIGDYFCIDAYTATPTITNLTIEDCIIQNSPYHGIIFGTAVSKLRIINNEILDCGAIDGGNGHAAGLYTTGVDIVFISNNLFSGSHEHGAYINDGSKYNIANNTFISNGGFGLSHRASDSVITNNVIMDNSIGEAFGGLAVHESSVITRNVTVSNNVIKGNAATDREVFIFGTFNLNFSNNVIESSIDRAILITSGTNTNDNLVISNNIIYGDGGASSYGIYFDDDGDNYKISDNTIINVNRGMHFINTTATKVVISDNFINSTTDCIQLYGATCAMDNVIIKGNKMIGGSVADTSNNTNQKIILDTTLIQSTDINTSAELAGVLGDETGTGKVVYNTAPVLYQNVTTSTTTNTLTVAEAGLILVSDAHTETLPTASGNTGLTYHFIKTDYDYDLITLEGDGAETFNYENSTSSPNLTYLRLNTPCAEVTIVSDGSNWQVIDEALGQVPECKVYLSADQLNLNGDEWNIINFDTEVYDIGSNFNTVTYQFTCPISGKYFISTNVITTAASTVADKGYRLKVSKNAGVMGFAFNQAAIVNLIGMVFSTNFSYSATDTIDIQCYPNVGAADDTVDILGSNDVTYSNLYIRLISKD